MVLNSWADFGSAPAHWWIHYIVDRPEFWSDYTLSDSDCDFTYYDDSFDCILSLLGFDLSDHLFSTVFPEIDDRELVTLFGIYEITLDITDRCDPFLHRNDWSLFIPRIHRPEFDFLFHKGKSYDFLKFWNVLRRNVISKKNLYAIGSSALQTMFWKYRFGSWIIQKQKPKLCWIVFCWNSQ
jgi:hypothetical protein